MSLEGSSILPIHRTVVYFTPMANPYPRGDRHHHSWWECSKKHALSLSEGFAQQGRSHFDARSVHFAREHGKMATSLRQGYGRQGTPLACLP